MFNIVMGAILVLCFIVLPLGIIGLFIETALDRRNAKPNRSAQESPQPAASPEMDNGRRDRRAVIYVTYGRRPEVAKEPADQSKPARTMEVQDR